MCILNIHAWTSKGFSAGVLLRLFMASASGNFHFAAMSHQAFVYLSRENQPCSQCTGDMPWNAKNHERWGVNVDELQPWLEEPQKQIHTSRPKHDSASPGGSAQSSFIIKPEKSHVQELSSPDLAFPLHQNSMSTFDNFGNGSIPAPPKDAWWSSTLAAIAAMAFSSCTGRALAKMAVILALDLEIPNVVLIWYGIIMNHLESESVCCYKVLFYVSKHEASDHGDLCPVWSACRWLLFHTFGWGSTQICPQDEIFSSKPPILGFSYGFPMVFLWFSYGLGYPL